MLTAGYYHTLKIARVSEFGLYLADEEGEEVLLPNRYVSLNDKEGDKTTVFVYHDSESRLVATTEKPLATVGQAAYLTVVDKNMYGHFLDWGLSAKHLFVPNSNQNERMEIGRKYTVYLYNDNITGRVTATARLNGYINNNEISVRSGQQVELLVARRLERGYRVIIDNRHWGMIYDDQIFRPVSVGSHLTGYITKITDDKRIDVSLTQTGFDEVVVSSQQLTEALRKNDGKINLNDSSSPEEIKAQLQMSKKCFKRAVGHLLKAGKIAMDDNGIKLTADHE